MMSDNGNLLNRFMKIYILSQDYRTWARLCHSILSVSGPSVCLSLRPFLTFRYRNHIGWHSKKIISRPNSLGPCAGWPQHGRSGATWTLLKLGWNRGAVNHEQKTCNISETVQDITVGPRLLWRTYTKSHTRFRLVPKSMTLDDHKRRIQGLPNVLKYPRLSRERVKLRTSNLTGTFTGSIRPKAH